MSWASNLSLSPNRPQRNRKRNKLIYYGDDDVSSEDEGKWKKRKSMKITHSPLAAVLPLPVKQDPLESSDVESTSGYEKIPSEVYEQNIPVSSSMISSPCSSNALVAPDRVTAKKIGLRLKNLLKLPKAHKMCIFEWFYSHIDRCLFEGDSDFLICLKESFPNLSKEGLTRAHWSKIRRIMGKPRRCSEAFFAEERNALENKRHKIRMLQQRKNGLEDNSTFIDLPKEIPMSLTLGTKVTARLRGAHEGVQLFTGKIDAVDIINSSYRITFDRRNVGCREVPDIEVASDDPQETIQLHSLIDRKRPLYNAFSPMQSDYHDGYSSPPIEYDPVLGQSPARSKLSCVPGGTLGGFPVKFLVQVARLSKILTIKKENLETLKEMNSQAEKRQSYGETIPIEFQRRYATVIIDLERLNKELNSLLHGIQKFCRELSPESTILCDQVSQIRQSAIESAEQMVDSKNLTANGKSAVKNCGLTNLVKQLTGIMMQIRFLRENNANPFEFKAITDTMNNIKQKIMSENMESFQNNVEIHIAHIQSGMNQAFLNIFMTMEADQSDQNDQLLEDLNENNERLVKALERVNALEQENTSLEDMLESLRKEQLTLVEYYEQENYSLKNKLSVHEKLALQYDTSLSEELEKWKIEKSHLEDRLSRQCKADVAVIRQQLEDTTAQLHQEKLMNAQQLETITMKNERIEKLSKDLRAARTSLNETLQVEFAELSNENDNLKVMVQENAVKELELRQTMEQLNEALESAKIKEENWKYEKENMQIELSSSYEMLQSCREEQLLLREKLNANQNVGISEKGNSLFAEVDDKRISAEKKFVGLASKYRCLQQQNQQFQRHILKLKMQIATLIETRSQTSDDKLIRSLDDALSSCRDENMKLMVELKRAREKVDNMEDMRNNQLGESSPIAKMLENEIKMKNGELAKVSEELRLSKIYSMVESRKVLDLEKQLYEKGKLLDAANSSKYRLQLEFDQFKSNLEKGVSSNADVEPVKELQFDCNKENQAPDSGTADARSSVVKDLPAVKHQMPRQPLAEKPIQLEPHRASKDISKINCSKLLTRTTIKESDNEVNSTPAVQQHTTQPSLAEKAIQLESHKASTDVAKNNCSSSSNTTTKESDKKENEKLEPPRRRRGFENTIDTSTNDCKQQ